MQELNEDLKKMMTKFTDGKSKYKSFVRPHLDYGDVLYDQPNNMSFCKRIESLQYQVCLAITGAIKSTS